MARGAQCIRPFPPQQGGECTEFNIYKFPIALFNWVEEQAFKEGILPQDWILKTLFRVAAKDGAKYLCPEWQAIQRRQALTFKLHPTVEGKWVFAKDPRGNAALLDAVRPLSIVATKKRSELRRERLAATLED